MKTNSSNLRCHMRHTLATATVLSLAITAFAQTLFVSNAGNDTISKSRLAAR